ncbi:MAG: 8-amino-7-oxononanoate synthase [Desulfuromonadales bacterium GWC2_61_20]|nr:MAG: 8-amino-7-oxononanoate synthase [Desulfuromonadales bacterium GWC2_61_20]
MVQRWRQQLADLAATGMLRTLRTVEPGEQGAVLIDGRRVLLLCSNNYLGLAEHPALIEAALAATSRYGVGSGGSRLISGSMFPHRQFEERLAAFKGTESALLFNSGYAANTGILQGLLEPEDVIFSDSLNHASIIDGCRLSPARTVVYPHSDVTALAALMAAESPQRRGRWLIVSDGVFSMDGDLAPIPALVRLKQQHDALLMIDDAHGTGVLGAGGRGTAEHFGCQGEVDLHMGTLGKALGGFGAYLAAARPIIEILINRSRSFIFSTALPPSVPAVASAALELVDSPAGAELRASLWQNRQRFVARLVAAGLDLAGSVTQIVPVLTYDPEPTMHAARRLLEAGIFLSGIRPPTVPAGRCRLRATVMATHDPLELDAAADAIVDAVKSYSLLVP